VKKNIFLLITASGIASSALGMQPGDVTDHRPFVSLFEVEMEATRRAALEANARHGLIVGARTHMEVEMDLDQAEKAARQAALEADPAISQSKQYAPSSQPKRKASNPLALTAGESDEAADMAKAVETIPGVDAILRAQIFAAQAVNIAERVLEKADTPEGKAILQLAGQAAKTALARWQADPFTEYTLHCRKLEAALAGDKETSLNEVDALFAASFCANNYCVEAARDAAKFEPSIFDAFLSARGQHLTKTQLDLLKLRKKTLDAAESKKTDK
jgi:hypothetical protein